jgi:hypothetical protein
MSYLTPGDYRKSIQADNLNQVISSDQSILDDAVETAIEEAMSRLIQKYDISREFKDTPAWDRADTYKALDRVYLDPPAYSITATYSAGDYVIVTTGTPPVSIVYKSIAGNAPGAFNAAQWDKVGYRYAIYNAQAPKPEFDYRTVYKAGDQVFWKDKVYTCIVPSSAITHELAIQYLTYANIPYGNVFPDDPVSGLQYWGAGTPYSIAGNTDITDITKWTPGDNRSKVVVRCVVACALYYVHDRISPRNIPDLRVKNYDDALKTLKDYAIGNDRTAINMVPIQPKQGGRIRWGGNVKNNNTY